MGARQNGLQLAWSAWSHFIQASGAAAVQNPLSGTGRGGRRAYRCLPISPLRRIDRRELGL